MKKTFLLLFMTVAALTASAQFEKKVTAQFSIGYAIPTGNLATYFGSGITLDGGIQYNFSRQFGLVALIKYNTFFLKNVGIDGKFNNLGISLCPKYTFSTGKVRPYVFVGPSYNFLSFQFSGGLSDSSSDLGYTFGGGLEFGAKENITWFTQLGINSIVDSDSDDTFSSTFIQVGVNINMFKSKSL